MSGLSNLRRYLRRPSRRQWTFFGVLFAIMFSLAALNINILAPIDWMLRAITAEINERPYEGDGVVILVDDKTISSLGGNGWSRADLAELVSVLGEANPQKIVIEPQYFPSQNDDETAVLRSVLKAADFELFWQIKMTPEEISEFTLSGSDAPKPSYDISEDRMDPAAIGVARPTTMLYRPVQYFASMGSWFDYHTSEFELPSTVQALSPGNAPLDNLYEVDVSYQWDTVPTFSAISVLERDIDVSDFEGRQIIIARWGDFGRDAILYKGGNWVPRASVTLFAAQTLKEGPSIQLGSLPAVLLATLACLAWLLFPRPAGRWIAFGAIFAILLSQVLLERFLVFQTTASGLTFLFAFGVAKVWMRNRRAARSYRDAAQSKSRFLSQASHDLRQPIHAIGLLAARLAQSDLSPAQSKLVSQINWSVDNASRMFRTLLDIAAIESGTLKKNIEPFSVNDVFADIDSQNSLVAEQNQVDLRLVPSEAIVQTDRVLLTTMVQNLVSNAIKYAPGKTVVVGCRRHKNSIRIEVIDSGRGIAEADLKLVKNEFYRTSNKSSLLTDSKGLGLAIVNQLADLLGLELELTSVEGSGTRAIIGGIPVSDGLPSHSTKRDQQMKPLSGLKVTFVEDDKETLFSTEKLLEQWGCDVSSFHKFPSENIDCDVLLSDFDFGQGGLLADHADQVAEHKGKGARVIVVSGRDQESIRMALADLPDLILSKPVRPAELRSALMASLMRE